MILNLKSLIAKYITFENNFYLKYEFELQMAEANLIAIFFSINGIFLQLFFVFWGKIYIIIKDFFKYV